MGTIYCIKNKINGKKYIGSSVDVKRRWSVHRRLLRKGLHDNAHLQASWNKYGEENFEFSIIEGDIENNSLREREGWHMKTLRTLDNKYGYNKNEELGNGSIRISEESKRKMSEAKKGEKSVWFGKFHSEETKQKLSQAKMGHLVSDDARKKMSDFGNSEEESLIRSERTKKWRSDPDKMENLIDGVKKSWNDPEMRANRVNSVCVRRYILVTPDREKYAIKSLASFAKVHNLSSPGLSEVARGIKKQYKGYTVRYMTNEEEILYEGLFINGLFVRIE